MSSSNFYFKRCPNALQCYSYPRNTTILSAVYGPVYLVPISIDFVFVKCVNSSIMLRLFTTIGTYCSVISITHYSVVLIVFFFFSNK